MPLYDYHCEKCKSIQEISHKIGEPPEKCEFCGGAMTRMFTGSTAIIYGCDGFYNTDYKPKRPKDN